MKKIINNLKISVGAALILQVIPCMMALCSFVTPIPLSSYVIYEEVLGLLLCMINICLIGVTIIDKTNSQ